MPSDDHYFLFFFGRRYESFCYYFSLKTGISIVFFSDFLQLVYVLDKLLKSFFKVAKIPFISMKLYILITIIGFLSGIIGLNGLHRMKAGWLFQYYIATILKHLLCFGLMLSYLKDNNIEPIQRFNQSLFYILILILGMFFSKVIWSAYIDMESNSNSLRLDKDELNISKSKKEDLASQMDQLDKKNS